MTTPLIPVNPNLPLVVPSDIVNRAFSIAGFDRRPETFPADLVEVGFRSFARMLALYGDAEIQLMANAAGFLQSGNEPAGFIYGFAANLLEAATNANLTTEGRDIGTINFALEGLSTGYTDANDYRLGSRQKVRELRALARKFGRGDTVDVRRAITERVTLTMGDPIRLLEIPGTGENVHLYEVPDNTAWIYILGGMIPSSGLVPLSTVRDETRVSLGVNSYSIHYVPRTGGNIGTVSVENRTSPASATAVYGIPPLTPDITGVTAAMLAESLLEHTEISEAHHSLPRLKIEEVGMIGNQRMTPGLQVASFASDSRAMYQVDIPENGTTTLLPDVGVLTTKRLLQALSEPSSRGSFTANITRTGLWGFQRVESNDLTPDTINVTYESTQSLNFTDVYVHTYKYTVGD